MKIQPVTIWANGLEQQADGFILNSSWDNLSTAATLTYNLVKLNPNVDNEGTNLANGSLDLQGQDYQDWDTSINANQWAYDWAAAQLNLVLIPE